MASRPRTFSLTQGKPNDERAYRPRSTSNASSRVYCCGDKEDVYSPGADKSDAEAPHMQNADRNVTAAGTTKLPGITHERGDSVTFDVNSTQQPTLSDDAPSQPTPSQVNPPLASLLQDPQQALFPVEPIDATAASSQNGKAGARGMGNGAGEEKTRQKDELPRSRHYVRTNKSVGVKPEATRRASLTASPVSLHGAPVTGLGVSRSVGPTTRPQHRKASLGSGSTSVVERLPPIATQEKDKFARLTAGDSVVVRAQSRRNSASSSAEVAGGGPAPAVRRSSRMVSEEDGVVGAAQSATRRIALKLEIATALKEIDFVALQDELCANPRHAVDGDRYRAAHSLFHVLTHERSVLTRDDLHDLLVLFTPPGAAKHEATDFFWEACERNAQLTLTQFIRYGPRLRERLFAYDRFAHITDAAQQLGEIATRVFDADAVATSDTSAPKEMCTKLLETAARQIEGALPLNVRPLRVYEYDFLLDYDTKLDAADGGGAEVRRVRRGVLSNVVVPAQRVPYIEDATEVADGSGEDISWLATAAAPSADPGRHDDALNKGGDRSHGQTGAAARAGMRGGLQSRGRPPCLSEDHLAMTGSDNLDDTLRRRVKRMLKGKTGTRAQGGCVMLDDLTWGEKERREQDELFIKRLYNKYNLPCN